MDELLLFSDGSVNPQSKVGYGAYLAVPNSRLSLDALKTRVQVKRFEQTSSTKLELQTLLWALKEVQGLSPKVMIYTDSQNIVTLPERRERLEESDYRSTTNRLLANHQLYQELFFLTDRMHCTLLKVSGHRASGQKTALDQIFALVDRASRRALRDAGR